MGRSDTHRGTGPLTSASSGVVHLRGGGTSVLFDAGGPDQPVLLHWGRDLSELTDDQLSAVVAAAVPAVPNAVLDAPVPRGLLPEAAAGYRGRPGLSGFRPSGGTAPRLRLQAVEPLPAAQAEQGVDFLLTDDEAGLAVRSSWRLDDSGVLRVHSELTNTAGTDYHLAELAVVLPVPPAADELMDFTGRWCRERAPQRRPFQFGSWTRENRRGRTAADNAFVVSAGSSGFGNRHGTIWSMHLGWSGNSTVWAEAQPDGTRVLGAAELLAPGEIVLAPGESYATPTVYAASSPAGLDGISDKFHRYLRSRPGHPNASRPAVLNTWEAVYFDHDLDRLTTLADQAAEVGIERFVLDDGWFGGRRNDLSSLGDWDVSVDMWPDGLGPLVSHVTGLGLQFGLWFEPEMINPDSDLFRAHRDWVLGPPDRLPPSARNQQVLDVAHPDAHRYLFGKIDALVKQNSIAFIKWDHNRDIVDAVHEGRPGVHAQTAAVYRLIDELKAANPGLEIESCSSGGARVDLGILARTERVWASDCNDALERQHIQRWTGLLLPPEMIGAHVGPPVAHTTGRHHSLGFRAATALFGHFGVEWDISAATQEEGDALAAVIAVYRRLRPMLHSGTVVHTDHPDPAATFGGIVAADRSSALFSYVQLRTGETEAPVPVRFAGLDPERSYTVTVLDPVGDTLCVQRRPPEWSEAGRVVLPGRVLETIGLPLPVLLPEQAILLEVTEAS